VKVSEKHAIIDKVGRELQSRYTFSEIDAYLAEFDIAPPNGVTANSKWVYAKTALAGVDLGTLARICDDLDLGAAPLIAAGSSPPAHWRDAKDFKLFISHVSKDKDKAMRLKSCLSGYAISGFVAHEDIHPTLEWQAEIERALLAMDALVAVHTVGFSASNWTQQEIGFALGRGVKVISFKMGEDPTGFISKRQALSRQGKTAEQVAKEIDALLHADPLTNARIEAAQQMNRSVTDVEDEIPF
jgi:hypothetical protein